MKRQRQSINVKKIKIDQGDALIIVDVQNDFLPGGALEVPESDIIIPVLNNYIDIFKRSLLPIVATRDWHPPEHCSFEKNGGMWPTHCVQGTKGAEFSPLLNLPPDTIIISKATFVDRDAYSGFEGTNLDNLLQSMGIKRLFVGGLATDYCVLNTVKDALEKGYEVFLLTDAIKAVNVNPDDGAKAEEEMVKAGAIPIKLEHLS